MGRLNWVYGVEDEEILKVQEENDLGGTIQDNQQSETHINSIFSDRYKIVRNIEITFHYIDEDMIKKK